jgi:hypothetical protein
VHWWLFGSCTGDGSELAVVGGRVCFKACVLQGKSVSHGGWTGVGADDEVDMEMGWDGIG